MLFVPLLVVVPAPVFPTSDHDVPLYFAIYLAFLTIVGAVVVKHLAAAQNANEIFLKTAFPSRKHTRQYKEGKL